MNEDFVCFEIANKLKENEFYCEYPFAMYNKYGQFCPLYSSDKYYFGIDDFDKHACIAPTISQVLKWLREEKKIHLIVEISDSGWYYTLYPNVRWENDEHGSDKYIMSFKHKSSYEQAALAGIEYIIDNLI